MSSPVRVRHSPRTRAVPARFRLASPAQQRGRETLERFAEATEELLRERAFEDISVQEIVRRAGRPIGSFYARFGSKEALLPFLYQRYHESLESLVEKRFTGPAWQGLGFAETVAAVVDAMIAPYTERRWLIRALALFARQHPEALPADLVARRQRVSAMLEGALLRHRAHIRHADPAAAARFGVYFVMCTAREHVLFPDAPQARLTPMTRSELRSSLAQALLGYLRAAK